MRKHLLVDFLKADLKTQVLFSTENHFRWSPVSVLGALCGEDYVGPACFLGPRTEIEAGEVSMGMSCR